MRNIQGALKKSRTDDALKKNEKCTDLIKKATKKIKLKTHERIYKKTFVNVNVTLFLLVLH